MTDRIHQHVTKPSMAPFQPAQSLREFFDTFEIPRISDVQIPVDRADRYYLLWKLIDEEYNEVVHMHVTPHRLTATRAPSLQVTADGEWRARR